MRFDGVYDRPVIGTAMVMCLLSILLAGCGPHHVQQTNFNCVKYECINWLQTIAICDTQEECNDICKSAREGTTK